MEKRVSFDGLYPESYPDSCINTCFSDLKRFGTTKKSK